MITIRHISFVCRQQDYAASVQIASRHASSSPSEALSFGEYDASKRFQSHASLSAQPNGSLALSSSHLSMLPANGTANVGSGILLMLSLIRHAEAVMLSNSGH